jgi:hypothetical protein
MAKSILCSFSKYIPNYNVPSYFEKIKSLSDERLESFDMNGCKVDLIETKIDKRKYFVTKQVLNYLDRTYEYKSKDSYFEFLLDNAKKSNEKIEIQKPYMFPVYLTASQEDEQVVLKYLSTFKPTELNSPIVVFRSPLSYKKDGKTEYIIDIYLTGIKTSENPNCELLKIILDDKECLALFPLTKDINLYDTLTISDEYSNKKLYTPIKVSQKKRSNSKKNHDEIDILSEKDSKEEELMDFNENQENNTSVNNSLKQKSNTEIENPQKKTKRTPRKSSENSKSQKKETKIISDLDKILVTNEIYDKIKDASTIIHECSSNYESHKTTITNYSITSIKESRQKLKEILTMSQGISQDIENLDSKLKESITENLQPLCQ